MMSVTALNNIYQLTTSDDRDKMETWLVAKKSWNEFFAAPLIEISTLMTCVGYCAVWGLMNEFAGAITFFREQVSKKY